MTRQDARRRAAALMQDGREDLLVAAFDRNRPTWSQDPFLVLQLGVALTRLDRLEAAGVAFHDALALPGITEAQRAFARRRLAFLDEEWQTVATGRAALGRARWGIFAGLGLLAVLCGVGWVIGRRRALAARG